MLTQPLQFSASSFFDERRRLFSLDQAACDRLSRLWPIVQPCLAEAMHKFVDAYRNMSISRTVFSTHGDAIRSLELEHFSLLLSGQLDDIYQQSCIDLCVQHAELGLTPRVRIMCANLVLQAVLDRLAQRNPLSAGKLARTARIFTNALGFDIATTLTIYQEAAAKGTDRRQVAIDVAIAEFEQIVGSVVANLRDAAGVLSQQTNTMLDRVEETNRRTRCASETTLEAASNVRATINATTELQSSITAISQQGLKSREIADKGGSDAEASMRVIRELAEAAQQIGSITNTISALAEQTNLLALNATIEAAHAGVAGRGFAIVAAEVKDLSRQTHAAAQRIGDQITAVQSASSHSIEQIGTVLDRMQQIAQVTSAIAASVCEQEVATQAISEAVRQTAGASARASENVKAIETVVEKNVVAAEEMAAWASRLSHDSGELTVKVDAFFRRVREA